MACRGLAASVDIIGHGGAIKLRASYPGVMIKTSLCLIILIMPQSVIAGMDNILEVIRQSEFRFARSGSEVPFIPLGWVEYDAYPDSEFENSENLLPPAKAAEHAFSSGAVVPVYVTQRDMYLLGADIMRDNIEVHAGPYRDQHIATFVPVAAWMHQFGREETLGAFIAPFFSKERVANQPWAVNGYAGVIGMHWSSDILQWVYGGVYEYSFGENILYPYLGVLWQPMPKVSLTAVFPWPTLSYTPVQGWLLELGISPGGSSWVRRGDGFQSVQSLGSWNLAAGVAHQLSGPFWLFAGAGVTGLRGVTINLGGEDARLKAQSSAVYTLAIQLRP